MEALSRGSKESKIESEERRCGRALAPFIGRVREHIGQQGEERVELVGAAPMALNGAWWCGRLQWEGKETEEGCGEVELVLH